MKRVLQWSLATMLSIGGSGCLMTRGGELPEVPKAQTAAIAPTTLSYKVNWSSNGNPNPLVGAIMGEPVIGPELGKAQVFKQAFQGEGGQNHLDISINNHGNTAVAVLTGALSGLTLTVLPGYARDDYDMTAVLKRDGKEIKRYQYTEHVTMVMELFLVFGMPFVEGREAPKNAVRDMTQHLVADMIADGSLAG